METFKITKLFEKNAETQKTIFHEIAEAGALHLLCRFRDNVEEPIAPFLQEKDKDGNLCIHIVVRKYKGAQAIQLLKVLAELGADLNAMNDIPSSTILHVAVANTDYRLVEWLVQQPQVDLNIKSWDQLTAYEIAFIENDYRMMDILKTHGAWCPDRELVFDWSNVQNRID